jgi:hypothetical protein
MAKKDIKATVARVKEKVEILEEQARSEGLAFSRPTDEQIEAKESGEASNTPYIYFQSWSGALSPGASASYNTGVRNPDPSSYYPTFVTVFFGLANPLAEIIQDGPSGRQPDWPYLAAGPEVLSAGADVTYSVTYEVPSGAQTGTYTGNSVAWRGDFHDAGAYFDRGLFYVRVS